MVIRDDPLEKNTHIESINLNKVKITAKAVKFLAVALRTNTTLKTLILNNTAIASDPFMDVVKALESENTTLTTLHVFQGPTKYFDSTIEKAFKDRLCCNETIVKLKLAPIRSTDVRNALQNMPVNNANSARKKVDNVDEWDKLGKNELNTRGFDCTHRFFYLCLDFSYDENDTYEYKYDPDWDAAEQYPTEIGSLKG